ncbi:MAG: sortase B protein-sorting domain-containing protein [Erysipelotrichaceae bacterium]|nr:sortase B protein-sorting domain-containing protein [Erysipelotrichaceae bacterium]
MLSEDTILYGKWIKATTDTDEPTPTTPSTPEENTPCETTTPTASTETTPSTSTTETSTSDTTTETVKTGDMTQMGLWIALLFVSGCGIVAYKKRKSILKR